MAEQVNTFSTTRVIHHGPGALAQLPDEIRKLGGTRVALITDPGVARAGLADRVRAAAGCELALFDQVEPEPPYPLVHQCVDFIRANDCDLIIGLGGGSSMDVAKMSAAMVANGGSVSDYWGVGFLPRPGLPVIAIPTTAGTSSEISPACVFVDPASQAKKRRALRVSVARRRHSGCGADPGFAPGLDGLHRHGRPGSRHRILYLAPRPAW